MPKINQGRTISIPATPAKTPSEIPPASPAGLSTQEAAQRLAQFGPNEPVQSRRAAAISELLALFLNPLVIILLVSSVVSFFLGDSADAVIILVIVLLGIAINFTHSFHEPPTTEKLREGVSPTATARRDGEWKEIP